MHRHYVQMVHHNGQLLAVRAVRVGPKFIGLTRSFAISFTQWLSLLPENWHPKRRGVLGLIGFEMPVALPLHRKAHDLGIMPLELVHTLFTFATCRTIHDKPALSIPF